mmetsp:Transcript_5742/g.23846  ORF Transcript_5742/g.23846 Transcript_5742/m.23846 type:complete len:238 (-) Transcript_5742:210-923(-)
MIEYRSPEKGSVAWGSVPSKRTTRCRRSSAPPESVQSSPPRNAPTARAYDGPALASSTWSAHSTLRLIWIDVYVASAGSLSAARRQRRRVRPGRCAAKLEHRAPKGAPLRTWTTPAHTDSISASGATLGRDVVGGSATDWSAARTSSSDNGPRSAARVQPNASKSRSCRGTGRFLRGVDALVRRRFFVGVAGRGWCGGAGVAGAATPPRGGPAALGRPPSATATSFLDRYRVPAAST